MRRRLDQLITGLAVLIWVVWAGYAGWTAWQIGSIISLLAAIQAGLIAAFLILRNPARKQGDGSGEPPWPQKIFAWAVTLSPALFVVRRENAAADVVTTAGLFLALWALVTLGRSFGIAPADRGLVSTGPYRFVRHPMYLGQFISVVGIASADFSIWNGLVLVLIAASAVIRILWEERALAGYSEYVGQVRWRLIPGLW